MNAHSKLGGRSETEMAELEEVVLRLVAEMQDDRHPISHSVWQIARKHGFLPAFLDMGGCYAIRPDGVIVSWAWDEEDSIREETDSRIRNIAYFQGAKRYAELAEFLPVRPATAITYNFCGGDGKFKRHGSALPCVCYCGGAGWLPTPGVGV